jgi:hypothetical protein
VKNEFKVRATDEELAKAQLEVTAPPKITFGMFQVRIKSILNRHFVLDFGAFIFPNLLFFFFFKFLPCLLLLYLVNSSPLCLLLSPTPLERVKLWRTGGATESSSTGSTGTANRPRKTIGSFATSW